MEDDVPDTPDFDQLARRLFALLDLRAEDENTISAQVDVAAEQLRLVWNARGAADLETIKEADQGKGRVLAFQLDLDRALRTLDR